MDTVRNLVLYAVEGGERRPLLSLPGDDNLAAAKFTAKVGHAMKDAENRGVAHPDFKIVSESRRADEGGKVVVFAEFQELDSDLKPVGKKCGELKDIFAPTLSPAAAPAEEPKAAASRRKSQ